MKNILRRAILFAGLALVWAAAPAQGTDAPNVCATASPSNPDQGSGGMGGTGVMATLLAPGSGGMGGTGIVGIITGFASICVNDVEVQYDASTPVSVNGQAAAAGDLGAGQLVVVNASTVGGQLRANGIGAIDAVNGPVTAVDPAAREIQVMGQTVRLGNAIAPDLAAIRPGTSVRVSGLRTESGIIVASRLDAVPAPSAASLMGMITAAEGNTAVVNGTRINLPQAALAQWLPPGTEVFVAGEWNGTALQAQRVEAQPVLNAIARTERAIVEGFVTSHKGNRLDIGAVSVQLSDRVRYTDGNARDAEVGRKVQVEIRRVGDAWLAERVLLRRSDNVRGEGRKSPSATTDDARADQESRPGRDGATGSQNSGGRDNSASSGSSGSSESGRSGNADPGASVSGHAESSNSGSGSGSSASGGSGSGGSGSVDSRSGNSASSTSRSNGSGAGSSGSSSGSSGSSGAGRSSGSGSSAGGGSRGGRGH